MSYIPFLTCATSELHVFALFFKVKLNMKIIPIPKKYEKRKRKRQTDRKTEERKTRRHLQNNNVETI